MRALLHTAVGCFSNRLEQWTGKRTYILSLPRQPDSRACCLSSMAVVSLETLDDLVEADFDVSASSSFVRLDRIPVQPSVGRYGEKEVEVLSKSANCGRSLISWIIDVRQVHRRARLNRRACWLS